MAQGALTATTAGEDVVSASEYRVLEAQVREQHRLFGKKAMEDELLRETVSRSAGPETAVAINLIAAGWTPRWTRSFRLLPAPTTSAAA